MMKDKKYYEQEASYEEYLEWYKKQDWPEYSKPSLTVDMVMFGWDSKLQKVKVLLIKRKAHPYKDMFALPGGFVEENEDVQVTVIREVQEETGVVVPTTKVEQLKTIATPYRDPRGWVVSVAHMVYLGNIADVEIQAGDDAKEVVWEPFEVLDGKVSLGVPLAFDHLEILQEAVTRVSNRLDYAPTALSVLGDTFILREVLRVYEQFKGLPPKTVDMSNFKRTHGKFFEELADSVVVGVGRPTKLYKLK